MRRCIQKSIQCEPIQRNWIGILSQAIIEDTVLSTPGARFYYDENTYAYHLFIPDVGKWRFERRNDLGGLRMSSGIVHLKTSLVTMSENLKLYSAD